MKMKSKTGYNVVFWAFVGITIACYIWAIISIVKLLIDIL